MLGGNTKLDLLKLMGSAIAMVAIAACSSDSDSQSSEPEETILEESSASRDSSDVNSDKKDSSEVQPDKKDSTSVTPDSSFTMAADLAFIKASDKKVTLGTNSSSAKANERPEMTVKLTYDFYMGKHEVTCAEFLKLRKTLGDKASIKCEGDSLPVSDITFYDAVLHANARSKSEGLDTAYRYSAATFGSDGHCTYLDGFLFDPEKDAYRLPTEAEWIYAANQNFSADHSWNADNSDYKVHQVCSKDSSENGICDMAGNVMEWVNDWMSNLRDTTVTNFVGAPDGGDFGERILKGGNYRTSPKAINTFSRGDVYTVTSSTRADYVGFRLAFGTIPSPTWMDKKGVANSRRILSLASQAGIHQLAGTAKAKLVFRNDITGNLTFIDFSSGTNAVLEIEDTISAYHPEISPDGIHVAFCTLPEGVSGNSQIYVRDLTAIGKNLKKLDVASATIPRWKILDNGDTAIVYVTSSESNKDDATFKNSSTWQVTFKNGEFGTPEKLFDGAYHGGISQDNRLAVSGTKLLRVRKANKSIYEKTAVDTIWYNGEQACNVSLAKDGSKRTAFLDFGSKTGKAFVGSSYGVHKQILIADSLGKLIQNIPAPDGYSFDHTEWASHNLLVATLTNVNGAHDKIVIINQEDKTTSEIISGEELWHPNLWIDSKAQASIASGIDPDSLGVYYFAGGSESALQLRNKMEILWTNLDAKLAILGSSRTFHGVNPLLLDDSLNAINLSNVPNSTYVSEFIFRNYLIRHLPKLKYVVVDLGIDFWYKRFTHSYDNFFYEQYKSYPGYVYDENHQFWPEGIPEALPQAAHEAYNFQVLADIYTPNRGFQPLDIGSWGTEVTVDYDSTWIDKDPDAFTENLNTIKAMVDSASNHNIIVIGVIFPQSPAFKNTNSFGRYGMRRSLADSLIQEIANVSKKFPNFIFVDENKMGDHDYTDEMAYDKDHLSALGAEHFTQRLDSLLKTLP